MKIDFDHPIVTYLFEHCGWIMNRYSKNSDGYSPYFRRWNRECSSGLCEFVEGVLWGFPPSRVKLMSRWEKGLWIGRDAETNEVKILNASGKLVRCRFIRRVISEETYDRKLLDAVTKKIDELDVRVETTETLSSLPASSSAGPVDEVEEEEEYTEMEEEETSPGQILEGFPTSTNMKITSDEVLDEEDMEERRTKRGRIAGVAIGLMSFAIGVVHKAIGEYRTYKCETNEEK